MILKSLFSFLFSFLFSYYLIPICISIAQKYNILDNPDGTVKTHKEPTPYLGGVAVYMGFIIALALIFPFDNRFFLFFIGTTLLFYLGLVDDLAPLNPLQKFIGQGIAVFCFIRAGFYLKAHFFYDIWTIPASMLWMLLVINAFNLIDIMDGLASLVACCCALNFLIFAYLTGEFHAALLMLALIGSLTAFFVFNKPKAKIYLGDAGSLFIGGILACAPFLLPWGIFSRYGYGIPLIILATPLLEVAGLIIIRSWKSIPFYKPSKDHFAHFLMRKGFCPKKILLFVLVAHVATICASVSFALGYISEMQLLMLAGIYLVAWIYLLFL